MKPTIFFSHSSLDKDLILPIKDHIIEKTGNSIQIFMSSDGASIPFGKNWLKEIEDALLNCKLMFIWVTPNSMQSNWIYFESGYAYSRDIKVVPIGFNGISLEEIAAPLSFLQGFNINSSSGFNNIIAIINKEFELSFPKIFDDKFYESTISEKITDQESEIINYVNEVTVSFHPNVQHDDGTKSRLNEGWLNIIQEILNKQKQSFTLRNNGEIFGAGFKIQAMKQSDKAYPSIRIDPIALNDLWPLLAESYKKLYDKVGKGVIMRVKLIEDYILPKDQHLVSSRLINSEVSNDTELPNFFFQFRDVYFLLGKKIDEKSRRINTNEETESELILIVPDDYKKSIPLLSLLKLLLKRKIIQIKAWLFWSKVTPYSG